MSQQRDANLRLLHEVYRGLEERSLEPIAAALHADVALHVDSAGELDGVHFGREAVLAFYEELVDRLELGFRVPPHDVLVHDASLLVAPKGTTFGGEADHGVDIYHFADGLISEIWITAWDSLAEAI